MLLMEEKFLFSRLKIVAGLLNIRSASKIADSAKDRKSNLKKKSCFRTLFEFAENWPPYQKTGIPEISKRIVCIIKNDMNLANKITQNKRFSIFSGKPVFRDRLRL